MHINTFVLNTSTFKISITDSLKEKVLLNRVKVELVGLRTPSQRLLRGPALNDFHKFYSI
jgi:hypothetical protein